MLLHTIQAPEAGVVLSKQTPLPNQQVQQGQHLLTLASSQRRWLEIAPSPALQLADKSLWELRHPNFQGPITVKIMRRSPLAHKGQPRWRAVGVGKEAQDALRNLAIGQALTSQAQLAPSEGAPEAE